MYNKYVSDINKGLSRATSDIIKGQALSTMALANTLNKNARFIANTIDANTTMLSQDIWDSTHVLTSEINDLSRNIEYGLDRLADGIVSLRADFDIAMGKVISQFEMMRSEIQNGLERIIDILQNKRKIDAQEHFQDALEFYRDGCRFPDKPQWFDDALKHFLASVDQYERNPLAHFHIGHIYHYEQKHQDFERALEHYRLCYTYGEANESDNPITAQGYFYAGWLCAAVFDDLDEAISLTEKVLEFDSRIGEAHYHLAKFYSLQGKANVSTKYLKHTIELFDRNYCIKASADPDFNDIRNEINGLFTRLKDDAKNRLEEILTPQFISLKNTFAPVLPSWKILLDDLWNSVAMYLGQNTYFGYLDAIKNAQELRKQFEWRYKLSQSLSSADLQEFDDIYGMLDDESVLKPSLRKRAYDKLEMIMDAITSSSSNKDLKSVMSQVKRLKSEVLSWYETKKNAASQHKRTK